MSREILFRGERIDNGEWVEGFYHFTNWYNPVTKELVETRYSILPVGGQDAFIVIPETVGQYTGITDKNSKKIFDSDIVRKGFECFVVKWNSNQCRWGLFDKHNFEVSGFNAHTKDYLEVIGNIHDNPELLSRETR